MNFPLEIPDSDSDITADICKLRGAARAVSLDAKISTWSSIIDRADRLHLDGANE